MGIQNLHPLIFCFLFTPFTNSEGGWNALAFVEKNGVAEEFGPPDLNNLDNYCRLEIWFEWSNQYVFVYRDENGDWSLPRLGEAPESEVNTFLDLAKHVSNNTKSRDIHPLLRVWVDWIRKQES